VLGPVSDPPADAANPAAGEPEGEEGPAPVLASHGLLPGWLSLRLALRARPVALLRRLLLAAVCAATGFLLLTALGHAAGHPGHGSDALPRLVWCVVPVAAVTQLAMALARVEARTAAAGLAVAGLGPVRLPVLAAARAVWVCLPGSAVALLAFTVTRHRLAGATPLPAAGVATLLAVTPLVAAVGCLVALWPRERWTHTVVGPVWGVAAIAAGLAAQLHSRGPLHPAHGGFPLPGGLGAIAPVDLVGRVLVVTGPALAGPGLVHLAGRLLALHRPGALRLLAGRALQADAGRTGRALGTLCAVVCAGVSGYAIRDTGAHPAGPLTALAVAVVVVCAVAALGCAVLDAVHDRAGVTAALTVLGAPVRVLRGCLLIRVAVPLAVLLPLTAALAWLAQPLHG
jgi:hypothetical protein